MSTTSARSSASTSRTSRPLRSGAKPSGNTADRAPHAIAIALLGLLALACGPSSNTVVTPAAPPHVVRAASLSAGNYATCAVTDAGEVYCWGSDCHGAPTDGAFKFVCSVPRRLEGLSNITAYVIGGSFLSPDCALKRDGSVACGRIDKGFRTLVPTKARAVVHADDFACALLESGRVTCWGFMGSAEMVGGAKDAVEMRGPEDVVNLTARTGRACAIASDARAWCWDYRAKVDETLPLFTKPPPARTIVLGAVHKYVDLGLSRLPWYLDPMKSVTEGGSACFLSPEGSLRCAGGVMLRGGVAEMSTRHFDSLAMGLEHGCALSSGKAHCWGYNGSGQLGSPGGARVALEPVAAEEDFVEIVAGYNFNCARTALGAVWCWGANKDGELGAGTRTPYERQPVRARGLGR